MSRIATVFIQKTGNKDDVIDILSTNVVGMYKLVYTPGDGKFKYRFSMIHGRVMDYMTNMLRTLSADIEPFDYIQIATHIGPSVMYNIADLDDREIRNDILNSILYALDSYPTKNETD